jgi:hypothetical protein
MSKPFRLACAVVSLTLTAPAFAQAAEYTVIDLSLDLPTTPSLQPLYPTSRAVALTESGAVAITGQRSTSSTDAMVWQAGVVQVAPLTGVFASCLDAAGNLGGIRPGSANGWYAGSSGALCVPDPSWCQSALYLYATSRVLAMEEGGRFTGDLSMIAPPGNPAPYLPQVEAYVATAAGGSLQIQRLGMFQGLSTVGWGINSLGEVVGTAGSATSAIPVLYRQGQFYALPMLRQAQNRASAINRVGLAVGYVSDLLPTPGFNACEGAVWDTSNPNAPTLQTIGQWNGSNRTLLQDIADTGVAVGSAIRNEVSVEQWRRAIRWDATRGIVALDSLLGAGSQWVISDAVAINEAGQIAAIGRLNGSTPRAILLNPVGSFADVPRPQGAHGSPCASAGCPSCPMVHGTVGAPTVGNAHFGVSLAGAAAHSIAFQAVGFGECSNPGTQVPGLCGPLWLASPLWSTLGHSMAGVGCGNTAMFPMALPSVPALAGLRVSSQCLTLCAGGGTAVSNCLNFVVRAE